MYQTGRTKTDHGFTLLELLIVIMLLSLVAVIGLTYLPGFLDRLAVERSARVIATALTRAAQGARATGVDQVIEFDSGDPPKLLTPRRAITLDPAIAMTWLGAKEVAADSKRSAIAFFATGGTSGGAVELRKGQAEIRLDVDWLSGTVQERAASHDAR